MTRCTRICGLSLCAALAFAPRSHAAVARDPGATPRAGSPQDTDTPPPLGGINPIAPKDTKPGYTPEQKRAGSVDEVPSPVVPSDTGPGDRLPALGDEGGERGVKGSINEPRIERGPESGPPPNERKPMQPSGRSLQPSLELPPLERRTPPPERLPLER